MVFQRFGFFFKIHKTHSLSLGILAVRFIAPLALNRRRPKMTRKPSLMTISYNEKACREINHHIKSIIGESIEVTSYYYTQIRPDVKIRDDLVLITTPLIQNEIIPKLEEGCPYLVARRSICLLYTSRCV